MKHKNGAETEAPLELWSMVDTMSPQYVFIGLRLEIKSYQYKKLYVKYKKLNGKSCIQNTKLCI
jgi:hypothetical protein